MRTQANDNKPIKPQPIKYENLPTKERLAKNEFEIYDSGRGRNVPVAKVRSLWLIDSLSPELISPSQHSAAVQLRELHEKQRMRNGAAQRYDGMPLADGSVEDLMVELITAKDKYLYVMRLICATNMLYWQLLDAVCLQDISTTATCKKLGLGRASNNRPFVQAGFSFLEDCMEQMHDHWNRVAKSLYKINN